MITIRNKSNKVIAYLDAEFEDEATDFTDLVLRDSGFASHNLEGAIFVGTYAVNSDFEEADLYWAHIDSANFSYSDFTNADLRSGIITDTIFYGCNFCGINISANNLGGKTIFRGCDLRRMQWDEKSRFHGAVYDQNCLFSPDFQPEAHGMIQEKSEEPFAPRYMIRNTTPDMDQINSANLFAAVLVQVNLAGVDFSHREMDFVDFSGSNLTNSRFKNTSLRCAIFYNSDLCGAIFAEESDLCNADLRHIRYDENTVFENVVYNDMTLLPADLEIRNPRKAALDCDFVTHWRMA